jgi:oxygen-dependent protoporphyrinogen oxidase
MNAASEVIVIGGGISGLATAWWLQGRGHDVALIEAAQRPGGTIGSLRHDGCLIESGPNSTQETTPLIGQLLEEVRIADERISANPLAGNRFVLRGGRMIPLPLSLPAFLTTPLFSWRAKFVIAREPFVAPAAADAEETVAEFVVRRLGTEFLDYAINPFVAGVYAGDPARLSVRAAFPRLFQLEQQYGSLIRGQILGARERKRNREKSRQAAPMLSFRDGMQTLTDAIARRLKRLELNTAASAIARHHGGGWVVAADAPGGTIAYRARTVIVATPADAAARLVRPLAPAAADALDAIPYPPVAAAVAAYDRTEIRHALDGFGFLVPAKENRRILGTIFSGTLFENRAPDGIALLSTFVGGMRQPELARYDEDAIAGLVQEELADVLGAPPRARWVRVARWPRAIPQYTLGHLERIARVEAAERELPGLFFCANYRGGISVADCTRSAFATAEQVATQLAPARRHLAAACSR